MVVDGEQTDRDGAAEIRYASFLIRHWTVSRDRHRIRIEHVQSGESTQVATLTAAIEWLTVHSDAPSPRTDRLETQPAVHVKRRMENG